MALTLKRSDDMNRTAAIHAACDAQDRESEPITQEHVGHQIGLRAERHADADLARSLRDGVGDDAIQADHAEQQRDAARDAQQNQRK